MSLLMEALRRAEEAKRQAQETAEQEASGTSAKTGESSEAPAAPEAPAWELSSTAETPEVEEELYERETLDDYRILIEEPLESPALNAERIDQLAQPSDDASEETDDEALATSRAAWRTHPRRKKARQRLYLIGGLLLLMLPIAGGFYWYVATQTATSGIAVQPRGFLDDESVAATAPAVANANEPAASLEDSSVPVAPAEIQAAADSPTAPAPAQPPAPPTTTSADANFTEPGARDAFAESRARQAAAVRVSRPATAAVAAAPISTSEAYALLQSGDAATATGQFQRILMEQPNHRDALRGLASASLLLGDNTTAQAAYVRLLQLDPADPLARAGLLESSYGADPLRHETGLRALVERHPEIPALSFALGNLMASQNRWREAQSAYYDALLAAKQLGNTATHPDYAYNLAVSLDQINQPRAAYNYYLEARQLAESAAASFDHSALDRRILALEQNIR